MVADPTTTLAEPTTKAALPSPTKDVGAPKTTSYRAATSSPVQRVAQFDVKIDPGFDPKLQSGLHESQAKESDRNGDPGPQSGVDDIPQEEPNTITQGKTEPAAQPLPSFDPDHVLPNEMSQIESALAPIPQTQPTIDQGNAASPEQTSFRAGNQYTAGADPSVDRESDDQVGIVNASSQTIYMPPSAPKPATTIPGHKDRPTSDVLSIHNNIGTAEVAATTKSVSVDQSGQLYPGSTSYQLLTSDPSLTTLPNGAVALPLPTVLLSTALLATAPSLTVSESATALDDVNDLVMNGSLPIETISPSQPILVSGKIIGSVSKYIPTSAPPKSCASELSTGMNVIITSGGLGGLIMGGLDTGAPSTS